MLSLSGGSDIITGLMRLLSFDRITSLVLGDAVAVNAMMGTDFLIKERSSLISA